MTIAQKIQEDIHRWASHTKTFLEDMITERATQADGTKNRDVPDMLPGVSRWEFSDGSTILVKDGKKISSHDWMIGPVLEAVTTLVPAPVKTPSYNSRCRRCGGPAADGSGLCDGCE